MFSLPLDERYRFINSFFAYVRSIVEPYKNSFSTTSDTVKMVPQRGFADSAETSSTAPPYRSSSSKERSKKKRSRRAKHKTDEASTTRRHKSERSASERSKNADDWESMESEDDEIPAMSK